MWKYSPRPHSYKTILQGLLLLSKEVGSWLLIVSTVFRHKRYTRFCWCFCRFRGLSKPEGSSLSFARSIQLLAFVWIIICGINLPLFILTDTQVTTTPNGLVTIVSCITLLQMTAQSRQIYWIIGRVPLFLIPIAITWVSYVGIYWKMVLARSKVWVSLKFVHKFRSLNLVKLWMHIICTKRYRFEKATLYVRADNNKKNYSFAEASILIGLQQMVRHS